MSRYNGLLKFRNEMKMWMYVKVSGREHSKREWGHKLSAEAKSYS